MTIGLNLTCSSVRRPTGSIASSQTPSECAASGSIRRGRRLFHHFIERRAREVESIDHAFVTHDVNAATFISPERRDALRRRAYLPDDLKRAVLLLQAPDTVRCVVAADVNAVK